MHDDETGAALAPHDALAIIAGQRAAAARTHPSAALLFGVWGTVWVLGYGLLWLTALDDDAPAGWAAVVAAVATVLAMLATAWHMVARTHGIRGRSAVQGAMYGWAWFVGFVAQGVTVSALAHAGASSVVISLAANAMATMVVGLLYLAGGVLWAAYAMYALGAWVLLTGAFGAFAGIPGSYAVLAFAGGGGMLAAALVLRLREGRRSA